MSGKVLNSQEIKNLPSMTEEEQISIIRKLGWEQVQYAVPVLVDMLPHSSGGVRESIVDALIEIGGIDAVERLVELIWHSDFTARNEAIRTIEGIGETGLPVLHPLLSHNDQDIRKFVVDILGNIASSKSIKPLIKLVDDPDVNVRAAVAESLGKMGGIESVPSLIKLLNDKDWVKMYAIESLACFHHPDVLPVLLPFVDNDNPMIAMAAMKAVSEQGDEKTIKILLSKLGKKSEVIDSFLILSIGIIISRLDLKPDQEEVECLTKHIHVILDNLQNEDLEAVEMAALLLSKIHSPKAVNSIVSYALQQEEIPEIVQDILSNSDELIVDSILSQIRIDNSYNLSFFIECLGSAALSKSLPFLYQCLEEGDEDIRIAAIHAIKNINDVSSCDELIPLLEDPIGHIRRASANALGEMKYFEAVPLLLYTMADKFEDVRMEAANALLKIGGDKVIDRISTLLQNDKEGARAAAAYALSKSDNPAPYEDDLIDALSDMDWKVRKYAVAALGSIKTEKALENLLFMLGDENNEVKMKVITALCSSGREDILDTLILSVKDEDVWIRYETARGLGSFKSAKAIDALIDCLEDESTVVQIAAMESLGKIGNLSRMKKIGEVGEDRVVEAISKLLDSDDFEVQDVAETILYDLRNNAGEDDSL